MPNELLYSPSFTALSTLTSGYFSMLHLLKTDWEHHLQFSEQLPDFAFIIEQLSNLLPKYFLVVLCASSYSSLRGMEAMNSFMFSMLFVYFSVMILYVIIALALALALAAYHIYC